MSRYKRPVEAHGLPRSLLRQVAPDVSGMKQIVSEKIQIQGVNRC